MFTCLTVTFVVSGSVWKNDTDILHTKQTDRLTSVMKDEVFRLGHSFTLKMEAVEFCETLANLHWATRCRVASIAHISVLFLVHHVPADNPIRHFR